MFNIIAGIFWLVTATVYFVIEILAPKGSLSYTSAMVGFFGSLILSKLYLDSRERD